MKLWIDDVRPAPEGYVWLKNTRAALRFITSPENRNEIELIDLDHDAGDFVQDGGDYIEILNELERLSRRITYVKGVAFHNDWHGLCQKIKFRLHSANPVGVANMRAIIQANDWKEVR